MLPKKGLSGITIPGMNSAVMLVRSSVMMRVPAARSQFSGMKPLQPL